MAANVEICRVFRPAPSPGVGHSKFIFFWNSWTSLYGQLDTTVKCRHFGQPHCCPYKRSEFSSMLILFALLNNFEWANHDNKGPCHFRVNNHWKPDSYKVNWIDLFILGSKQFKLHLFYLSGICESVCWFHPQQVSWETGNDMDNIILRTQN